MPSIEDLLEETSQQEEPRIVAPSKTDLGGVDPLGLRQINFGLMDRVLPDLNNVARHIRPYVVMAWAWRRVRTIVETGKTMGASDAEMRDFVDRIEAIYAWSQFLNDPNTDIPGRQAMQALISEKSYNFGGPAWEARRNMRRYSTGFISPLNYGPSLRTLGWLLPVEQGLGVFQPDPTLDPLLDKFEHAIRDELGHEAFSEFGEVKVKRKDARRWGALWRLHDLAKIEKKTMFSRLGGSEASNVRREGIALVIAAYTDLQKPDPSAEAIRTRMADFPEAWNNESSRPAVSDEWRTLQVRQLFRLALESLFFWTIGELFQGPMRSAQLAQTFLTSVKSATEVPGTAEEWMLSANAEDNPVELLRQIQVELHRRPRDDRQLAAAIISALAFCLMEAPDQSHAFESADRLPLRRAKQDADAWSGLRPVEFLTRIFESWIMAQHAYWAVGRGLADARSRGKQILRLKIVMDEGGWTLTPGTTKQGNPPEPTPDRLETAISLLKECGKLK